jgi:hypothetical protein
VLAEIVTHVPISKLSCGRKKNIETFAYLGTYRYTPIVLRRWIFPTKTNALHATNYIQKLKK